MLKKVRLELARGPGLPEGSAQCGYDLVAPLDAHGRFDSESWRVSRDSCTVRRFWKGQDDQHGRIVHPGESRWAFSYRPGEDDDEPIFKLEGHVFRPGEYVTITEADGPSHTFKVVSVE